MCVSCLWDDDWGGSMAACMLRAVCEWEELMHGRNPPMGMGASFRRMRMCGKHANGPNPPSLPDSLMCSVQCRRLCLVCAVSTIVWTSPHQPPSPRRGAPSTTFFGQPRDTNETLGAGAVEGAEGGVAALVTGRGRPRQRPDASLAQAQRRFNCMLLAETHCRIRDSAKVCRPTLRRRRVTVQAGGTFHSPRLYPCFLVVWAQHAAFGVFSAGGRLIKTESCPPLRWVHGSEGVRSGPPTDQATEGSRCTRGCPPALHSPSFGLDPEGEGCGAKP